MRPRPLAVTLGDPAGIGPEIVARAWDALKADGPPFVVIGDFETVDAAMRTRVRGGAARRVLGPDTALDAYPDALPVLDQPLTQAVVSGKPSPAHAASVVQWIDTAVGLALTGDVSGIVTAPIAKAPLYEAGFKFPGHTEYRAELTGNAPYTGARGPVMMLAAPALRTVLTTIHEPLGRVAERLSANRIVHAGLVTYEALQRDFGIETPRLAMAALNPHAGEGGALGREEIEVIAPAVTRLRAMGIEVTDARPADTLFHNEARQTYNAVICLYHDQALIPVKMLDFWGGVNVSLGLPIVRTSPDHGTGFDIAGQGIARPDSLIAAIRMADQVANGRAAQVRP